MRRSISTAIALTALLFATPSLAASQQDRDDCDRESMAQAIAACSRVIDDSDTTDRVTAYMNRAAAYSATGEYDRAIADYNDVLRLEPKNATALYGRGTAKRRKGDTDGSEADFAAGSAVKAAERDAARDQERRRMTDIARIVAPTARQALAATARQKLCNEEVLRVIATIRKDSADVDWDMAAIQENPAKLCEYGKNTGLPRIGHQVVALGETQDWAITHNCDATEVLTAGNMQVQAFRNYSSAVVNDCRQANQPPPPKAGAARDWIVCASGTMPAAITIAACTEIIDAPGETPEGRKNAYLRRALLRHDTDYAGAIADFDEAVRLAPKSPIALVRRCWGRAIAGRELEKALDDCNEALRLAPNFFGALDSRGLVYLQLGDLDKAIDDYDAALDISPALAASLYGRGIAKRRKGDIGGGDADIATATKITPGVTAMMERYGVK